MIKLKMDPSQDFLDNEQYEQSNILKYEFIFGAGYISPGGGDSTAALFSESNDISKCLNSNAAVLDIGCGIGGGANYLVEKFGSSVTGVDLASHCINLAKERYADNNKLEFIIGDAITHPFQPNTFDLIYSRDAILHIQSKLALFKNLLRAAKPGGRLYITDYCCGGLPDSWNQEFTDYVAQRGYSLLTLQQYKQVIEEAGWVIDEVKDETNWFRQILVEESINARNKSSEFAAKFGDETALFDLLEGWNAKMVRVDSGHLKWGVFSAHKQL